MIDLNMSEVAALLELIAWEREDGGSLAQSPTRDAELRSARHKLVSRPASSTKVIAGARKVKESAQEERTLMLAWIVRHFPVSAHLATARPDAGNGTNMLPWAVCIHTARGPMAWRISDIEATAYFSQLKRSDCQHGIVTRDQKLRILADLASSK